MCVALINDIKTFPSESYSSNALTAHCFTTHRQQLGNMQLVCFANDNTIAGYAECTHTHTNDATAAAAQPNALAEFNWLALAHEQTKNTAICAQSPGQHI